MKPRLPHLQLPGSLFDQVAITAIALLGIGIAGILQNGEKMPLKVTDFSWEGQKIGVEDKHFTLKFNHPVDPASVEKQLALEPPLLGKISWQSNNLVYTLSDTPLYGTNYQIKLEQATDRGQQGLMQPFNQIFSTHNRALVYIGITGEERGRLVLYDITNPKQPQKTILTAKDLLVRTFRIYPQGDKILFSAQDPNRVEGPLQLFTVTTGLQNSPQQTPNRPGKLESVLGDDDYNNLSFDLSRDGHTLILLRVHRQNPADVGLWVKKEGEAARPLGIQGENYVVAPNGRFVAVAQRGGVSLIPLSMEAGPSRFLEGFERPIAFSQNGQRLLLSQNNADYTRSLILREADGTVEEVARGVYPILNCQFEPRREQFLYCLRTDLVRREDGNLHEEPFLSVISLDSWQDTPLLALPNYRDVQMNISPDGAVLVFDQVATSLAMSPSDVLTPSRQAITDGRVWILNIPDGNPLSSAIMPRELTPGFNPQWLP